MRSRSVFRWLFATALLSGCNALTGADGLVATNQELPGDERDERDDAGPVAPYQHRDASRPNEAGSAGDAGAADDASLPASDAGADGDAGRKRVFATSVQTNANLGGLAGGDAKCMQIASTAGLGGTWTAWLSTSTKNAIQRMTGAGPWYLTTGELAVTRAQLTSPPISHRIERDEMGKLVTGLVWTGTDIDGTFLDDDCVDWTSSSNQNHAATGDSHVTDEPWTAATPAGCGEPHRLYCFEQ